MDEENATADARAPQPDAAAPAPQPDAPAPQPDAPALQPAPESAAQGPQGQDSGLPSLAGIDTPAADASTTPPEADSGDDAGVPGETPKTVPAPIPRPRPEGVAPFTTAAAPQAIEPSPTPQTSVADVALELKPGSVIKGAKGLIPIPAPRPPAP
jgi:hypothetical protein